MRNVELKMITCSDEHVSDDLRSSIFIFHPGTEEVHHAGQVILVRQPGHHLHIEAGPGEVPGVDVVNQLLESSRIHLFDVDLLSSPLQHVGLDGRSEHGGADREETLMNLEDLLVVLLPAQIFRSVVLSIGRVERYLGRDL